MREPWSSRFLFAFFFILSSIAAQSQNSVNLSTTWTNDESSIPSTNFTDGSRIRTVLFIRDDSSGFRCGFFCNGTCTSYLFAIVIPPVYSWLDPPVVIWSANGDCPVRHGAILNLTAAGELVLHDVDGSLVWTTNTTGKSIVGMNLTDEGNLMLFDDHDSTVWQSFDHPTDCLVAGQKLLLGQKLVSSVSFTNLTAQKDSYSLQLTDEGLFASVETNGNPPQVYFYHLKEYIDYDMSISYVQFVNGSLSFFYNSYNFSYGYVGR